MRHRRHRGRRRHRRRLAPSVSIAGYTRAITLAGTTSGTAFTTTLVTQDVQDVETPSTETVNRKIVGVSGEAMFAANLAANRNLLAQFCLWAHPEHESWPSVADYDPFNEGPGESAFEGMLAPRAFCRRTFVINTPAGGVAETVLNQHRVKTKAQRLLRPGWKLTAGLYVRGSAASLAYSHASLLRVNVAG